MSPQDPPQQPAQDRPQLRAVPKRRGRPPKRYPAPPLIPPIPDAHGLHARVGPATDHGMTVTWVPATVKAGYWIGHRPGTGCDGEDVILGTFEIPTTVTGPDGITHVIPAQLLMLDQVALSMDIEGALASATYEHDLALTYPDGSPLLGQTHHDRVAAYRRRRAQNRSRD